MEAPSLQSVVVLLGLCFIDRFGQVHELLTDGAAHLRKFGMRCADRAGIVGGMDVVVRRLAHCKREFFNVI